MGSGSRSNGAGTRQTARRWLRPPGVLVGVCLLVVGSACGSSGKAGSSASSSTTASTSPSSSPPSAKIQSAVGQVVTALQSLQIPGGVVGVSVNGQGSQVQPFGTTAPGGSPVTAQTHFMIGSITKTFTATAVLRLVDQGKVHLSDPISKYVPGIPNGQAITLTEVMNHTSGIPDFGDSPSFQQQETANPNMVWTPQQLVSMAATLPAYFPPGGGWKYSNTNYVLLGLVLQAVTGQPAAQVIASQVLAPLGLRNTGMATSTQPPQPGAQANEILVSAQGTNPHLVTTPGALNPSVYWTAGGMYSTVGDLQIWAQALATGKLLSPATQQARLAFVNTGESVPALQQLGGSNTYPVTYGLGIYNLGGILGHDGEINGWNAVVGYLPSANATFVVLLNAEVRAGSSSGTAMPVPTTDLAAIALAQLTVPTSLHPGTASGTPGQPAQ